MADTTSQITRLCTASAQGIMDAIELLSAGAVAAIPTETVYGLAADAANSEAVARIYAAKGRPSFNPLIVHVSSLEMAKTYADLPPLAIKLAEKFWPGPLTIVAPTKVDAPVSALVTAGLPTIALRFPAHPVMQAVIKGLGRGLAAPSANASGRLSPTRAEHVLESLNGRIPMVLDGGPAEAGLESSIVAVNGDQVHMLRLGAIARETIQAAIQQDVTLAGDAEPISAPGMMLSHYAPRLPIRLNAITAEKHEFHIGFGAVSGDESLSAVGDTQEAAARLFDVLHRADKSGRTGIAVAPIPDTHLGPAINDRLKRAAAG